MVNLQNNKRSAYTADNLAKLEASLGDYWDKSRSLESETVADLEKHLWLANGAAHRVHRLLSKPRPLSAMAVRWRLGICIRILFSRSLEIRVFG